jgi:hypothetical protein
LFVVYSKYGHYREVKEQREILRVDQLSDIYPSRRESAIGAVTRLGSGQFGVHFAPDKRNSSFLLDRYRGSFPGDKAPRA